jgi:hypothetical protein
MTISRTLRQEIAATAQYRCGYCLCQESVIGMPLEIEHIIPRAQGGTSEPENLWLACVFCNRYKGKQIAGWDEITGQQVMLFNPRTQVWVEHFAWVENGVYIKGITAVGRVTTNLLRLNNSFTVRSRHLWVSWGQHPPADSIR